MKLSEIRKKYPGCEVFKFGDSKELSENLIALVLSGKKTATCEALSLYESGKEAMPKVGRIDIALNWNGAPAVAIRTLEIDIKNFNDVQEEFALAEGEDEDLEGWRKGHQEYFKRTGEFTPDMKLVCEKFEVVEIYD